MRSVRLMPLLAAILAASSLATAGQASAAVGPTSKMEKSSDRERYFDALSRGDYEDALAISSAMEPGDTKKDRSYVLTFRGRRCWA